MLICGFSPSHWHVLGLVVLVRGSAGVAVSAVVVYDSSEGPKSYPPNYLPLPGFLLRFYVLRSRPIVALWLFMNFTLPLVLRLAFKVYLPRVLGDGD